MTAPLSSYHISIFLLVLLSAISASPPSATNSNDSDSDLVLLLAFKVQLAALFASLLATGQRAEAYSEAGKAQWRRREWPRAWACVWADGEEGGRRGDELQGEGRHGGSKEEGDGEERDGMVATARRRLRE